ncbi:MAG TPA: S-adenosylmethionine:tRNA ribosyltransferase-isomerase [Thermoanaerobaculia bacterium]|jgi:S-adenosylmethionine:tRNA ribosyltransferase-isomerase|nr:S-adenosylmethionine:tRNA ribosyltransferase-isomerase [Thermoanaerobaculia bacterium]
MTPATRPPDRTLDERLLVVEPRSGRLEDRRIRDLPRLLRRGDLVVVNDAATLPASLQGRTSAGEPIEARLAGGAGENGKWTAALLGRGDWRTRTEDRPPPPHVAAGDVLRFGEDLGATVESVSPVSPRLVSLAFDRGGDGLWEALYRHGRPIQYSYLEAPLAMWDVQTSYGSRPWAVELPSAGRPLNWELLGALRRQGIALASITHGAGLSSIGDAAADAILPMPERFEVPVATVEAERKARSRGGRVVAVGTSVVRALEGSAVAHTGRLAAGAGVTDVRIDETFPLQVVDGLLTGLHEPGTTHFALTTAFAPEETLTNAYRHAEAGGYFGHEFGDEMLILPDDFDTS